MTVQKTSTKAGLVRRVARKFLGVMQQKLSINKKVKGCFARRSDFKGLLGAEGRGSVLWEQLK